MPEISRRWIKNSRTVRRTYYTPHVLAFGVNGALASLDLVSGKKYLRMMASNLHTYKNNVYAAEYHYLLGWKALLEGDLALSLEYLNKALPVGQDCREVIGLPSCHLGLAHLLTEQGEYGQAAVHLTQTQRIIERGENYFAKYKWLLIKAQLAFKKSHKKQGLDYFKKAMSLSREKGIKFIDFFHPAVMARLCVKALEAGIEIEYVQKLIRTLNLVPDVPPLNCDHWPWPLKIFTLGGFSVLKEGKPLQFAAKIQKKPLEMLKVLISAGGRNITEGKICDILWPDAYGDMAYLSFNTTLHRLRKLLGYEKAIQRRDGKISLNSKYCWVDTIAFERTLTKADTAWGKADKEKAVQLITKAIALYHGQFLADEENPWALLPRDRLRSKFIRSIEKLGGHLQETGKHQSAVEYYNRGIEIDGLAEKFYQHLMLCLKRYSRQAEAIAVYHRCKKNLATILGILPSPQTESIYQSLLKK